MFDALQQDLRYTLRDLRAHPGFAIAVVVTLALGIGANAAIFGIVDRLLFRPPAHLVAPERAHRLYFARHLDNGKELVDSKTQYQRFRDLAVASSSMEVLTAYTNRLLAVGSGDAAEERVIGAASASLWRLFDVKPAIGRFFGPEEDRDSGARAIVLSYPFWQSRFGGSRDVVGKTIAIGRAQYTIIGVAPRGFSAAETSTPAGFIPISAAAVDGFGSMWERFRGTYRITWLEVLGRRKPGVSPEAAAADLSLAYRSSYMKEIALRPQTMSIAQAQPHVIVGSILADRGPEASPDSKVAAWLLGVAGVVLLIACANVGNLLLARAFSRRRELAMRWALGASRARLATQLLVESALLAVLGLAAGVAAAEWGGQVLRAILLPNVEWDRPAADPRVLLFAGVCAAGAGLLAGLAPITSVGRSDLAAVFKAGAREGHGRRSGTRTALLVLQGALSVVLLVGAGLFVRSLRNAHTIHLGYDAERLVWLEPHLRGTKLDSARSVALQRALLERALTNPAVQNASLVMTVPFSSTWFNDIFASGTDSLRRVKDVMAQVASPGYFATTGTQVIRGRAFSEMDRAGAPLTVIVSDSLAHAAWPNTNAIGRCLRLTADTMPCRTVVGIAEDIRSADLDAPPAPMFYVPAAQDGDSRRANLFVRMRGDGALDAESLRRDLQQVMPGAGYIVARPLSSILSAQTRSWRLGATMFAAFGALALVLASVGLYSVMAYTVAQRRYEMGVRIALGARKGDVVRLVIRDGVRVASIGVALGLLVALAGSHWLAPLLFHVSPSDPIVFAGVAAVLVAVALLASWLPASRATAVDPSTALRAD